MHAASETQGLHIIGSKFCPELPTPNFIRTCIMTHIPHILHDKTSFPTKSESDQIGSVRPEFELVPSSRFILSNDMSQHRRSSGFDHVVVYVNICAALLFYSAGFTSHILIQT
jgi:hypothetical protein